MGRKFFFFDYDGTLALYHTRTIPQSAQDALRRLEEQGHFIALATGRLQANAVDFVRSIGLKNLVADGGYSVTLDGELKWMKSLEVDAVKAFLHRCDEAGLPWAVTTENELLRYSPYEDFDERCPDKYVPTRFVPEFDIDALTCVYKAYVPIRPEEEDAAVASGLLDGVPWVRYDVRSLFIEPLSKYVGIKKIMDLHGAPYEDAVVFGDGLNDLTMFRPEWTSIAMGNAKPQLKAKADYITSDVGQDGVANALRHFGWIE